MSMKAAAEPIISTGDVTENPPFKINNNSNIIYIFPTLSCVGNADDTELKQQCAGASSNRRGGSCNERTKR